MWPVPSPAPPPWSRPTDPVWEHQSGSPPSPETSMLAGHNPNDRPVMPANSGIECLRQLPQFCRSSAWSGALDCANLMLLRLNSVWLKGTALAAVLRDAGRHRRLEHSPAERLGCIALLVLVTGGTGYVGSHSIAALVGAGHRIRVLARSPEKIPAALNPLGVD